MFKNMLKSKEQRQQDEVEFNRRIFPLGDQQRLMVQEMVLRLSQKCTNDPMLFYFYLVAYDHFLQEHGRDNDKTQKYLNSIKPKITAEVRAELLVLMSFTHRMENMSDFPSEKIIIEMAKEGK